MGYFDYWIFMLPALILTLWAQFSVKSTYDRFSKVSNRHGMTGAEAAERILRQNGVYGVRIERVNGKLTDHFDPRSNVLRLSDGVYGSSSVAAVGIAAHEAGHAIQHDQEYFPIRIRSALVPVCNIGARIAPFLILLGFLLDIAGLFLVGVFGFVLVALFQLVTLPVEFNASRRAVVALESSGSFAGEEMSGVKKVLRAAAMTYVAALFTSFMQILYYLSRFSNGRRRR